VLKELDGYTLEILNGENHDNTPPVRCLRKEEK
jgi:hypothetical protein